MRHMPREFYLKRAVESYERAGDPRAAAAVLAGFGTPAASADAARRYVALGDLPAAGEAYLAAGEIHNALACFRQARLPERELACLVALGDDGATGALLLTLGRPAEAVPLLERALAAAHAPAPQVQLRFQLAQALGVTAGEAHYRVALDQVEELPATRASAEAWVALGAWGEAAGRQDRTQEGYAEALLLLVSAADWPRWREVTTRYRAAAQAMGNRRLVQILDAELAERAATPDPVVPPDPAHALLDTEQWEAALSTLEPRARAGDETAKALLATLVEGRGSAGRYPPLPLRLQAAALLGEVGDPRLLNPQTGDAPLGGYWCQLEAGPFWYGDDRNNELRRETLPYPYRIGRYPVTNNEYRRFIEAGGYQEQRWWTEQGWTYLQPGGFRYTGEPERITLPRLWDNATYNEPTQPVVGVSWYEAAAYCAWLTEVGRAARWVAANASLRLPTSLEWERAARGLDDQRRYPWGNEAPDAERANYQATGLGRPSAVGCFPAGAAACGALDMAGNVLEWLSTPSGEPGRVEAQKDFTLSDRVMVTWSYHDSQVEQLCCGSRNWDNPDVGGDAGSFRVFWPLALLV